MQTRKNWTSRIGFVLASVGAAVGLGAIWKFPYLAGSNGGSAFLFPYIVLTFTVGLTLLIAEVALGRAGRGGIVTSFRRLAGQRWVPFGYLGVLTGFLVLSFYSAIGGWTISYFADAITGTTISTDTAALGAHFGRLTSDPVMTLGFQWVFLLINCFVLAFDVTKGIERLSKIFMPILFLLMIILIIRGVTLPGGMDGVAYLFKFDWNQLTLHGLYQAMGFTFFSLAVGSGCMLTYGSYLKEDSNMVSGCVQITSLTMIASLLGGLMIMPAVFAFGLEPGAGPGLTFMTMPAVFAQLPFGQGFAILFYFCIMIAALTSSVSMLEIVVAFLVDEKGLTRAKASVYSTIALVIVGALPALSFGILSDVTFFGGKTFFDIFDFFTSNLSLPIGALVVLALSGHFCWKTVRDQLGPMNETNLRLLKFSMTVFSPLVVLVVLITGLM